MVFERVKKLLAEQLMVDEAAITMEAKLTDDLGADSLDLVQMLIIMEKEFGLSFTDEQMQSIKTVGDVVKFIEDNGN